MTPTKLSNVLCAFGLLAAACTTSSERSDLVATKVVEPTAVNGGTSGTVTCELNASTAELVFGSVDPAVAPSYLLGLVVENRLLSNANIAGGRLNSNDFQVEQIRASYEFPDPAFQPAGLGEHVVPANGLIKVGASGVVGAQLFPPDVIGLLKGAGSGTIRIKVRAEGRFVDGSAAKSSQYEYVVRSCSGCGSPLPASCVAPAKPFTCAPGQDAATGCQ